MWDPPASWSSKQRPAIHGIRWWSGHHALAPVLGAVVTLVPGVLAAQTSTAPSTTDTAHVVRALKVPGGIQLDGELNEDVWSSADVASGFIQATPKPGAPSSARTEARVLFTDDAVYVGMRMFDSAPHLIAAQLARRDAVDAYSDWAHVVIDSYNDGRTAFGFAVNPAGVLRDTLYFNDGDGEDLGWDAVWDAVAKVDSDGWTAEFRIPLSQLRFSPSSQQWGIQFVREIARLNERVLWAPIPPDALRFVSLFGTLSGLSGLGSKRRVEIVPYTSTSLTREPGMSTDPFYSKNNPNLKFGGDVRYGLGSNLTLNATIHPDFGQLEADPSIVNLTAFETFFPEKRPFFIEGTGIFRFGLGLGGSDSENEQVFYSRRIGRAPQGLVPESARFSEAAEVTPILGAAKISGRTAGGWSIGLLDAVTGHQRAQYVTATDERRTVSVEPLTNYAVLRISKDFSAGSALGVIATAVNRQLSDSVLTSRLHSAAYTFAMDGRHRFANGNYEASAQVAGSRVQGSPQAIALTQRSAVHGFHRPDNRHERFDPSRQALNGFAGSATLRKLSGNWQWSVLGLARSPGFDVNDIGYLRQADQIVGGTFVSYQQYQPGRLFNDWTLSVGGSSMWTFGGERTSTSVNLNGRFRLRNYWGWSILAQRRFAALSTTELRGGPALRMPGGTDTRFGLFTDSRRPINAKVDVFATFDDDTNGRAVNLPVTLTVRPSPQVELSFGPELSWRETAAQYVTQNPTSARTRYVFGNLEHTTLALTLRLGYAFTPALSFDLYGQPFVSAGDFSTFREVLEPRADRLVARFREFGVSEIGFNPRTNMYETTGEDGFTFRNPDFNLKQLRSNAVLRWEYREGSTLFIVWSHGRTATSPAGSFALGRDLSDLFSTESTNVVLVKMNYWFDW